MKYLTSSKPSGNAVFECLADRDRRLALAVLGSHPAGLTESALVDRVIARRETESPEAVTAQDRRRLRLSLDHKHLPRLIDADLVVRDAETDRLSVTDHPALVDPHVRRAIGRSQDQSDLDATFDALADWRRRAALSVLDSANGPIEPRTLARRIAAREVNCPPSAVPDATVHSVHTALEHVHLPKLRDAGLVSRDDGGSLTAERLPVLDADWVTVESIHESGDDAPVQLRS